MIITDDLSYAVMVTPRKDPGQCHVDFRIWELGGTTANDGVEYPIDMAGQLLTEESPLYCHGTVKWDGCINFDFDERPNVMLHFCSMIGPGNSFDAFRDALAQAYRLCHTEMGDKWLDCIDELGGDIR